MTDLDKIVSVDGRSITLVALKGGASGKESGTAGLGVKERLDILSQRVGMARDPDLAREIVKGARQALEKAGDQAAQYTYREALGLEAVVQTIDRPSFDVQDGFLNSADPRFEQFGFKLRKLQDRIRDVTSAVGRIEVEGNRHIGTAFYFAEGRIVTNRHVLEEIAIQASGGAWKLKWPESTTIDFDGEEGASSNPQFKVVGASFWGDAPIQRQINFAHLDLAVLEILPMAGASFPNVISLGHSVDELSRERWVYTVGFPGRPKLWKASSHPLPGYEIASVIEDTFAGNFECKKFAPGQILDAPGSLNGDEATAWVFAHDCSTLRGNSGSAVVEFTSHGSRVLGIHFGGVARSSNWGHAFSALKDIMGKQGAIYA